MKDETNRKRIDHEIQNDYKKMPDDEIEHSQNLIIKYFKDAGLELDIGKTQIDGISIKKIIATGCSSDKNSSNTVTEEIQKILNGINTLKDKIKMKGGKYTRKHKHSRKSRNHTQRRNIK